MLTLLNPIALFGLGLLAIPVAIHLLAPRKVRMTPFSSLRWLRASQHRMSKRIRWHQVLLFLLRAAFLTLIVLALSRPAWRSRAGGAGSGVVDRFIVLDTGRTMGYETPGQPTPLQRGVAAVQELLADTSGGQRATVVLAGGPEGSRPIGPLTEHPTEYARRLVDVAPSAGPADLAGALDTIATMMPTVRPEADVELVIVTDTRPHLWSQAAIARFIDAPAWEQSDQALHVRVIDVAAGATPNAWIAGARVVEQREGEGRAIRVEVASNASTPQQRRVVLTGLNGAAPITQDVTIEPDRVATMDLPLPEGAAEQVVKLQLEPADGLTDDDQFWLPLSASDRPQRVVLIEGPVTPGAAAPRVYLRAALDALRETGRYHAELVASAHDQVRADDLLEADLIVLADVPSIDPNLSTSLTRHLAGGGGVLVFVGPHVEPESYDATGLMPAMIGEPVRPDGDAPALVVRSAGDPLVRGMFDPVRDDLARVHVRTWRALTPRDAARVPVTLADEAPLLIARRAGAGTVLLVNTTANDVWSDLPRRKGFLPLLDRVFEQLAGGALDGMRHVGEPMRLALPVEPPVEVSVTAPSGQTLRTRVRDDGGRAVALVEPAREPGIHTLRIVAGDTTESRPLVVQTDRTDSAMGRLSEEQLRELWPNVDLAVATASPQSPSGAAAATSSAELEPWLVLLACIALAAEMYLVHRRCPAVAPAIASSVVSRGIVRPTQTFTDAGPNPTEPKVAEPIA